MKRSLLLGAALVASLGAAHAADFATKAPTLSRLVEAVQAPSWSGFYAGLNAGYAAGDLSVLDTNGGVAPGPFGYSVFGGTGGGQVGYNYAINPLFLVGLEGQLGYMGLQGSGVIGSSNAAAHQDLTLDSGLYGDVTGRLGVTMGNFLVYGKAGWAWFDGEARQTTTNPGYATTGTSTFNGWTAGAGIEYLVTAHLSVKAEYQYYDFGSQDGFQTNLADLSSPIGYNFNNTTSLKFNTAKLGLNYHF